MFIFFGFIILGFILVCSALGFIILKYGIETTIDINSVNGAQKQSVYKSIEKNKGVKNG